MALLSYTTLGDTITYYAAHGLRSGWASSLFRKILSSNNSSKRHSGSAILRSSLATIISGRESPKINCSSAARITLLFFRIGPFHREFRWADAEGASKRGHAYVRSYAASQGVRARG